MTRFIHLFQSTLFNIHKCILTFEAAYFKLARAAIRVKISGLTPSSSRTGLKGGRKASVVSSGLRQSLVNKQGQKEGERRKDRRIPIWREKTVRRREMLAAAPP